MLFYYKVNNFKMGDNSDKKTYESPIFSRGIQYMIVQKLAYMVLNLCYAHESNMWPKIAKGHNSNKISLNWLKI